MPALSMVVLVVNGWWAFENWFKTDFIEFWNDGTPKAWNSSFGSGATWQQTYIGVLVLAVVIIAIVVLVTDLTDDADPDVALDVARDVGIDAIEESGTLTSADNPAESPPRIA